ncbi:O-6 methyl-guanine alkyl transferase [Trypanosoma grayi]|uniref:O-6 methyl-guanine alkyl transferase n=1 Tax=Trypanosoma grayi TaxID=71804 RepID=UPI0004F470ED|nr:O-6 methyl-guanine alkyl transferase [Trypanosoma grayi]KEG09009.1 O-6 methyl-guanine alkyl transferase [Trypanosoma grayi]
MAPQVRCLCYPPRISADPEPLRLYRYTTPTPIGEFVVLVDAEGAVRLSNWTDCEEYALGRLRRAYNPREIVVLDAAALTTGGEAGEGADADVRSFAVRQLQRFFGYPTVGTNEKSCENGAGSLHQDDNVPIRIRQQELHALLAAVNVELAPSTQFQQATWRVLREVHCGAVTTYGALAARCQRPNASRAVGQAMRENHHCVFLPCHRVVGASRALTGFSSGLWRKSWLLWHEQAPLPVQQLQHAELELRVSLKRPRK